MARYQSGHVFEAYGTFHVRYYVTEIVDGQPKRVQRSKWLCKKDNHQPGNHIAPSWNRWL